ncbi:MAG: hypothetical protein D6675_16140 [Gemmatimonadetes bacterium]|nr:MAG: hypothetical protein D6675_16140 [Gemmatimonadota bacterium]
MRKYLMLITVLVLIGVPWVLLAQESDTLRTRDDAIAYALKLIKMTPNDAHFWRDIVEPDTFRLSMVNHLLEHPLESPAYVDSLATVFADSGITLAEQVQFMYHQLDYPPVPQTAPHTVSPFPQLPKIPVPVQEAVQVLWQGIRAAQGSLNRIYGDLTPEEQMMLRHHAVQLFEQEEDAAWENKTVWELDAEEKAATQFWKRYWNLMKRVDRQAIADAGVTLLEAVVKADQLLSEAEIDSLSDTVACAGAHGDVIDCTETEWGRVVIGGSGQTIYTGDFAIIIDLGGDDIYNSRAGGADSLLTTSVCLDLAGDDRYLAKTRFSVGAGSFGAGVLVDAAGDDLYQVGNAALGCGLLGTGVLWDKSGSDSYLGDSGVQAAAILGVGLLRDDSGNDMYQANFQAQGFAGVWGFGGIDERAGNDLYNTQAKYTDRLRYKDHSLTLSQGFSIGWRPDHSGGIGLIAEAGGNDVYVSDIYGQGSAYWFALGGIVDRTGNDTYKSYQYAQGAGIHIAVGILKDDAGRDQYISNGVSQGCGHDYGCGYLLDLTGDDTYACEGLSQGAGNANGLGILVDEAGADSYVAKHWQNCHGYGNARREFGSIGMLIDLHGQDEYTGEARNAPFWIKSTWGVKADFESQEKK